MSALIGSSGVVAVPIAFAATAAAETLVLGTILLMKVQRRLRTAAPQMRTASVS